MVIFLVVFGSLFALTVAVLCVPVEATLSLNMPAEHRFRLRVRWLFGLVSKDIKGRKAKKEKPAPAVKKRKPSPGFRVFLRVLTTRGLVGQVVALVKDLLRCVKIRSLAVSMRVGLGDPADTGILFGIIAPVLVLLPSSPDREMSVQPDFQRSVLEGHLDGTVRLRPISLFPPVIRFVFSAPVRRTVRRLIAAQRHKS